jgi:AraC-like DNA-binding protein
MSGFAPIAPGSDSWNAHCCIPRHRHQRAYAAVILSGGYEECGSRGRYRVHSGCVLLHRTFDAHLDRFDGHGAQILNVLLDEEPQFGLGAVADPDLIARTAGKDPTAAASALREQLVPIVPRTADWPDLLARDLLENPQLRLDGWAERYGLAPETLSRGFGKVFGTSPAAFRAEARTQGALALIEAGGASLAAVAASAGFADQAHMTRAVSALTGRPPGYWLRSNRFKTLRAASPYKEAWLPTSLRRRDCG